MFSALYYRACFCLFTCIWKRQGFSLFLSKYWNWFPPSPLPIYPGNESFPPCPVGVLLNTQGPGGIQETFFIYSFIHSSFHPLSPIYPFFQFIILTFLSSFQLLFLLLFSHSYNFSFFHFFILLSFYPFIYSFIVSSFHSSLHLLCFLSFFHP